VAKTSHYEKLNNCAGKGITLEVAANSPVRMQYRGIALEWESGGEQTRDQAS
jgi:hypothetical protein